MCMNIVSWASGYSRHYLPIEVLHLTKLFWPFVTSLYSELSTITLRKMLPNISIRKLGSVLNEAIKIRKFKSVHDLCKRQRCSPKLHLLPNIYQTPAWGRPCDQFWPIDCGQKWHVLVSCRSIEKQESDSPNTFPLLWGLWRCAFQMVKLQNSKISFSLEFWVTLWRRVPMSP